MKKLLKSLSKPLWAAMHNFYNFPCESPTLWRLQDFFNRWAVRFDPPTFKVAADSKQFQEIMARSTGLTDLSDHLAILFKESLSSKPELIVELGVGQGESLFVFERVAQICQSKIISVDIVDCNSVGSYDNWFFVQDNDTLFARKFDEWCKERSIIPDIDILFVDTSHCYEHTCEEIRLWFPYLSKRAKVFFHDTNLKRLYFRKNYTVGLGWNNNRGVIRALEDYFQTSFNEKKDFITILQGWIITHYSHCNGLTILERMPS
uniref:Class I SAM-dependent methyltransferase n=1 Tax=Desulfobacca acetoxidans TaxID=60893 RepID=A0A7C3UXG9_9BACT